MWSVHFLFVVLLFMWEQSASEKFSWKKMHHQKFKRILWYFLEGHISALINFLMFVDPKLLYWTATKQQLGVAQKGEVGDKVLWNLEGQPHVLLDFCQLKKTYHQVGTHTGIEEGVGPPPMVNMEGAQTDIGEGGGPP